MSLNKDSAIPRSSRRVNSSRLSVDRTPQSQSDEFFTDSLLDASKIPTPTSKKQPFHKAYKERRALGKSKIPKSSWKSSARGSFSDSDASSQSAHHLRPTKLPSPSRTPSPLRQINRMSTPPAVASPTTQSVLSSPAHGLDETYKRIAEEEDIAAQEGQMEDEEEYTDEMWNNEAYGQSFHPDDESQTDGPNSETDEDDHHGPGKENVPLDEGTAPTDVSGMSFLEGLTDQNLAAKLTPHAVQAAKDRALLEKATQRQTPIHFKGNKNGPSLSERLQRRSTMDVDESSRQEEPLTPNSALDDFQEPSPNVPKSWARQKPGRDWMQRSRQKREQGMIGAASGHALDSSQVDWAAAAADIALPSVEDNSTPRATSSIQSSPASLHSQRSLDRIRHWELNDFTGQSLQVSDSPPVRPRTNVVDQMQQREIERLEQQAVTTSRLGQYRKRDPNELIKILSRQRSPSASPGPNKYPTPEPSATPPASSFHPRFTAAATSSVSAQKAKAVTFAEEGEPVPNTPVVVYRSSGSSSDNNPNNVRPGHDRSVSEDRLARLARAMSNSPKPSSSPDDQSLLEPVKDLSDEDTQDAGARAVAHDEVIEQVVKENQNEAQKAENSRQSSKQFAQSDTTPKASKISEATKTPKVTGAWTDTILPETVVRTARKQERQGLAETPHVSAGGWIETPFPDGKRQSSAMASIPVAEEGEEEHVPVPEDLTNGISKPREETSQGVTVQSAPPVEAEAPKSALTSLLARAKSRLTTSGPPGQFTAESNDTLALNDSTINSLEDLLTLDNAELTTLIRMGAESEAREQLIRDHLVAEPIAEAELLERLGGKLERLRTNIHDARRGIGRLEHQVATSSDPSTAPRKPDTACKVCGVHNDGYVVSLHLPFSIPRLFHQRKPNHYLPRPTWLGWLTILAWTWYLAETAMCERYAHPIYADHTYRWPSEPEPSFPLVLPTMLWRWSGRKVVPTLLGPVWWLLVALFRVVGQAMGWTDGFVDDGIMATHGPTVAQVLGAMEDAAGMDGDAFI